MIKPGINLCNRCGRTSTGLFYASVEDPSRLWVLDWDSRDRTFCLRPREQDPSVSDIPLLTDAESIRQDNFPPNPLMARMGYSEQSRIFYRCCPECREPFDTDLIGKVPGYVIAVMGITSAGKTSLLGALSNPETLIPLNLQDYPFILKPTRFIGNAEKIEATLPGRTGNTNYFSIIDKETKQTAALVYLLDYGGELYKSQSLFSDSPVRNLLKALAGEGYPGIDALIVVDRAVDEGAEADPSEDSDNSRSADLARTLDQIHVQDGRPFPIAHVITCGDKLLAQELRKTLSPDAIPALTEKTFPATVYTQETIRSLKRHFAPEAIRDRFLLHQSFYNRGQLGNHLEGYFGRNTRHFLVQSCTPNPGAPGNDYRTQFNVADPLIWLLNELEIFPL